ncbi:MAG: hypothetical protein ACRBB0_16685 [Pelagimonas sp.]|uniref:hypothetical protein n=1 Tax=Pelagimonas sp. TaxID=2073170 RepID=UPI003D6BD767
MRSPINAPILATACVIGLGIVAQAAASGAPYEGPFHRLWKAAFQSEITEPVHQNAIHTEMPQGNGYWL